MKKFAVLFVSIILFWSCEGPQGPAGYNGKDGEIIASKAFEIEVNFNNANAYQHTENYGFDVYPTDVTLVYMLWETNNGTEVWRQLPQQVTFDDGSHLTYNFDFTQTNVRFFLEGTVNLNTLNTDWTSGQVLRVVVVPADNVGSLDTNNYNNLIENLKLTSFSKK